MMLRVLALFALVVGAAALSVSLDDKASGNGVAKVVNLLKDMQTQLEKEQEADEDMYDAYSCWCEANNKAKSKAIADAEQRTADLESTIEMLTAKDVQLKTDIEELKNQIAENEKGLAESTELRAKEAGEFHQNEMDTTQAIGNLKAAVVALQKVHGESLSQEVMLQLQAVMNSHGKLGMAPQHKKIIASLLQESSSDRRSAAPASGAIFGILKQMKEEFETNLVKAQQDEKTAIETFDEMKTAKSEEIAAGNEESGNKATELANANEKNAQSKEDLEDTTAQLAADRTFLADVKDRCGKMDKEWAVRTKVRQEEMTAVGEALEILTDDDARDLMAKTTFVQTSMRRSGSAREMASRVLRNAAKKFGNSKLSMLALAMQDDVFAKVKESIDMMVGQLKKEQIDEVAKKDWCRDELHKNDMETTAQYETKEDLEAKVANLETLKGRLTEEIKAAKDEIAETQVEIQRASENRQKSNSEFQMTVADQRATQEILAKAMDKLKGFYSKKAALLQSQRNPLVGAPPPGEFQPYKKKGGAGGVMGMIGTIIDESKQVEDEARSAEQAGQETYEQFVADSGASIAALQQEIADKQEQMATADGDLVRAKEDLASSLETLEDLNKKNGELHNECDYITENFAARQEAARRRSKP